MTREQAAKKVEVLLHHLGEHFDAVQILVSWREEGTGNTVDCFLGTGNWYARQGMAHEFLERDVAQTQANEVSKALTPPEE